MKGLKRACEATSCGFAFKFDTSIRGGGLCFYGWSNWVVVRGKNGRAYKPPGFLMIIDVCVALDFLSLTDVSKLMMDLYSSSRG